MPQRSLFKENAGGTRTHTFNILDRVLYTTKLQLSWLNANHTYKYVYTDVVDGLNLSNSWAIIGLWIETCMGTVHITYRIACRTNSHIASASTLVHTSQFLYIDEAFR